MPISLVPISKYAEVPIRKYAAEEDYPESLFRQEEEEESEMKYLESREVSQEYMDLEGSTLEKVKWLDDKDQTVSSREAQSWVAEELEVAQSELRDENEKAIYEALGEDAKYYEEVTNIYEYAAEMVMDMTSRSRDEMSPEDSLQKVVDDLRKYHGKEAERSKQKAEEEQKEYEETRDTVRHMQSPGEHEQVEFTTDPRKLENMPGPGLSGALASKRGGTMLVKLFKLAYTLDRKGYYNEASEIEEVMKTLSQRVGLDVKDMVSLADYCDDQGDTPLADRFDSMAKAAAKK